MNYLIHEWGREYTVVEDRIRTQHKPGITMAGQRIVARGFHTKAAARQFISTLEAKERKK
ncbi:MAG: hypothetical protein WC749_10365 [Dehalococcoidia bacterium]